MHDSVEMASRPLGMSHVSMRACIDAGDLWNGRSRQASHLDELRDDMKARLSAERKDRTKAMHDIYHEMEQKLQRMEGIREDVLKETEARFAGPGFVCNIQIC